MFYPNWILAVWSWLKKYWAWLLLPIGAGLWLLGRLSGKKTVVVTSSVLEQADAAKRVVDAEAAAKLRQENAQAAAKMAGIAADHAADVASISQKHVTEAAAVQGDSEKVNDLLLDVGKDMRR